MTAPKIEADKELTPEADLVLRITAISEAWGFDGISKKAIFQAFEILEPLLKGKPDNE